MRKRLARFVEALVRDPVGVFGVGGLPCGFFFSFFLFLAERIRIDAVDPVDDVDAAELARRRRTLREDCDIHVDAAVVDAVVVEVRVVGRAVSSRAREDEDRRRYQRMISYFASLLVSVREPCCDERRQTAVAENAMAGGVALLVGRRLAHDRAGELPAAASEATQFVLTPWVGTDRARRIANEHC